MPSRPALGAMSLERRALEKPESVGVARALAMWRARGPLARSGLGCTAEDWRWRSPRAWASPACPCGGPVARLRAGRPRSQGRRPSATRRPCAAGQFQSRSEEADGSVSGTCSCTFARGTRSRWWRRMCSWRSGRRRSGCARRTKRGPVSDVLGARASCPHRAEGPQGADRSDTPEPATPPSRPLPRAGHSPEPPTPPARGAQCRRGRPWVPCRGRALEKPASVASPTCPCGGPAARLRAGRPRSQGVAL